MTKNPEEIQARISELNSLISCVCRQYREVEETRKQLDNEIMTLHREKWSLERELITIKICPAVKTPRRYRAEKERCATTELPVDTMIALLGQMSIEQREALQRLVDQRLEDIDPTTEGNNDEEA